METIRIMDKDYKVLKMVKTARGAAVPLVDLELMDDSTWERLAEENAISRAKECYSGKLKGR